jgi:glycosyltransferase involved in cell wall biosynthesis
MSGKHGGGPPDRPIGVLHVLGTAEPGGTGISEMVRTLSKQLDPSEFELVACYLGTSGPWTARLNELGVAAFEVPWTSPTDILGAWRFWRFLRSRRVDVLHIHYGGRSVRWLARAATGAGVIVHLHGRIRSEDDYRLVPQLLADTDAVIATSRAVADVVTAGRLRVVYPGVPAAPGNGRHHSRTIGAAGRLVPIKGYDHLIAALELVHREFPDVRLEIAGDGSSRDELERQVASLGLSNHVHFLGWVDDLPAAMKNWSVFAQPSMEEALGITVLQAMAAGLPVVASAVGGLPELVEEGVTGRLVSRGNARELAAALVGLLENQALATRLGEAGLQRSGWFTEQRFAEGVAGVYRETLATHHRRSNEG